MTKVETVTKKEAVKVPELVLYPVSEVIAQSEQLFNVPSYVAVAALQGISEVDVNTAEKKIKSLLKKEVK
ncbi:hypothetical protein [Bacillus sp. AFS075034]|uniref:hypothetical protein n=1 Tax=Bacillus sp. AFS075034 TaxID=2034281 RepID=UPI000BF37786|nr:hypothetical protein [Bacillus sp. AFS075034]PFW61548.1 hypothetical protein COL20_17045 [Bacillus sp. AFS075034]